MSKRKTRIAYVVSAWGGPRRGQRKKIDWLRIHFDRLAKLKTSLVTETIVVVPQGGETEDLRETLNKLEAQGCHIFRRKNVGLSYGCFTDAYGVYKDHIDVDYWMFIEDDWTLVEEFWDKRIVEMYRKSEAGLLCGLASGDGPASAANWRQRGERPRHAAISNGITSTEVIQKVWEHHGHTIPYVGCGKRGNVYFRQGGQVEWSNAWAKAGFSIHDVTEFGYRAAYWDLNYVVLWDGHNRKDFMLPLQIKPEDVPYAKYKYRTDHHLRGPNEF